MSKSKRRILGRGTLAIVAGLLIVSSVIRMSEGIGQALARAPESDTKDMVVERPTPADTAGDHAGIIAAFQAREARLEAREAALNDRMVALRVADEEVSRKLAQLEAAESKLRETIALAETASETDLDKLTKVYETMKPKQAAALFEQMDPNFAAGFLGRMRAEAAAAIMAGLSPEAAHMYSVVLAGRNANVPTE